LGSPPNKNRDLEAILSPCFNFLFLSPPSTTRIELNPSPSPVDLISVRYSMRSNCRGAPCGYPKTVGDSPQRTGTRPAPTGLGNIVGAFKSITTPEYIRGVKQHGWAPFPGKLWQRNYYEHIIRNENKYLRSTTGNIIHKGALIEE